MPDPSRIVAYIDGGARGNPGPAGFGVRIESGKGVLLDELRGALGVTTNNVAEYRALIAALAYAIERGYRTLHIRSDSELLVRQMSGAYKVRSPALRLLHRQARTLIDRLDRVTFEHVPRAQNAEADRLVNEAIDVGE